MKFASIFFVGVFFFLSCQSNFIDTSARTIIPLEKNWRFIHQDIKNAEKASTLDSDWEIVTVPHDWAIQGPFDENIDVQYSIRTVNGKKDTLKRTGRTGALPFTGVGWYRKHIDIPKSFQGKRIFIEFDGAMSHARVFLNGNFVGEWPYGYASFGFDLTRFVKFGTSNLLAVRLENFPQSSRWYPGAGLYREVRLIVTHPVHIKKWGKIITTPNIQNGGGDVSIKTEIKNQSRNPIQVVLQTEIVDPQGKTTASTKSQHSVAKAFVFQQNLLVDNPQLWDVDSPTLYKTVSKVFAAGELVDTDTTTFAFRYFKFTNNNGFLINGTQKKLNGVCLHHDLGPLGAAYNQSAMRYRLKLLKEMGCNAIRTSHNPPAPQFLDLCDEMGFVVMDEAFDEWKYGKVKNGYHTLFEKWAEKDLRAFVRRDRNHPSVILWSVGNEIREQGKPDGGEIAQKLVEIVHEEDQTRPVAAGLNSPKAAIKNGLAEVLDVVGLNYKPKLYREIHRAHPGWPLLASETASTVSTRGEYFFPAEIRIMYTRKPYFCSSYDLEYPGWATTPDEEFAAQDDNPFVAGEFVWTGIDYLGEPTPYNLQWPSRSSYFGIIDLCAIPKDRYYLYQSKWSNKEVLHLLPHWNWQGHEGQPIPVFCYTSYDSAELFLNGKSLGVRHKNPNEMIGRYRLIWRDVKYEPGALKVIGFDKSGKPAKEAIVRTAGAPAKIKLSPSRTFLKANGKDIAFVTVSIVDSDGNLCPRADYEVRFRVKGHGFLRAVGNGDETSLESFVGNERKAFNGMCMAMVQTTEKPGKIKLTAAAEGLQSSDVIITSH